jgi:hypothetical protein
MRRLLAIIEWLFLLTPWDIITRLFSFVRSESGALATPLASAFEARKRRT